MKKEKSCGALVYRTGGEGLEVLLIQHRNGKHWAFPKGHVEKGETERETAVREIREETGLSVRLDEDFHEVVTYTSKPDTVKDVVYFSAVVISGEEVIQEEELLAIAWMNADEATEKITYDNDKQVLKAFLEHKKMIYE